MSVSPIENLREIDAESTVRAQARDHGVAIRDDVLDDFLSSGTGFCSSSPELTRQWYTAGALLLSCVITGPNQSAMLAEGGPYHGCWLESTGSISAEILSRFCPSVSRSTFDLYPEYQRDDGLLPYKIAPNRALYSQVQMVSPLARSAWNHYCLTGRDRAFLGRMYETLSRFDTWLSTHRDTRGTGAVEAFCAYDTGHDFSPRFWHVPDTTHLQDAARFDPDSPLLPFIAPDLTAHVHCQRKYLALMARELGEDDGIATEWESKAAASLSALIAQCYDKDDAFYYDRDVSGRHVKVQSDVLLRVLASEVGDDAQFAESLERYLLNTRKFFARYPFTSIAMDDPRFDPHQEYNTWAGTSNFLSLIRAPHAFETHGRHVELSWVIQPTLSALARARRFAQNISPWNGEEGYAEVYSPAMLCLLDFTERLCGILPGPDDTLWFTGLTPSRIRGCAGTGLATAYRRKAGDSIFELQVDAPDESGQGTATVWVNGEKRIEFPRGLRLITDREGNPIELLGMVPRTVRGKISWNHIEAGVELSGNRIGRIADDRIEPETTRVPAPDIVRPVTW